MLKKTSDTRLALTKIPSFRIVKQKMKTVRVLMLITNMGKGGAQRVFYDHSTAFMRFVDVEEAVFNRDHQDRIYDTNLPLHDLDRPTLLYRLGPLGRMFSRALTLRRIVAERGFDVVISHMDGANWVNVLSFSRARKILVVHGTILRDENIKGVKQWLRLNCIFPALYNLADRTVAVSEGIARELHQSAGVSDVHAIPNFFDLGALRRAAKIPVPSRFERIFERRNVLITSGRLSEQKKQIHLLDLLSQLKSRFQDACLVILGDGELRTHLINRCAELNLSTFTAWESASLAKREYDVYFLGYVENPYQYLSRSTLFLFPSAWEGFPLALCEAMICGLPVVTADCPTGPREILAPRTINDAYDLRSAEEAPGGVLMPLIEAPGAFEVWVETVSRLLNDPNKQENLKIGATEAVEHLDETRILRQWQDLIACVSHNF